MSGWIKFEKDLQTDPRVIRMARQLDQRFALFDATAASPDGTFDPCNAQALHGVTLVCGALVRLWCLADAHVTEDDVLDLGPEDIDAQIGIPGFCQLMPADWLQIIDAESVKLPNFHTHNGTESRKKAVTAKRVARFREGNAPALRGVTQEALPDQDQTKTRPDQDHTQDARAKSAEVPRGTPESREAWLTIQAKYPKTPTRGNWLLAERNAFRLVEAGKSTWPDLEAQVGAYAAFCRATARQVAPPELFFAEDGKDRWAGDWTVPKRERQQRGGLTPDAEAWKPEELRDAG